MISSEYYTVTYRNKATGKAVNEVKEVGTYEVVVTFKDLYEGQVVKQIVVENTNKPSNPKTDNPNALKEISERVADAYVQSLPSTEKTSLKAFVAAAEKAEWK